MGGARFIAPREEAVQEESLLSRAWRLSTYALRIAELDELIIWKTFITSLICPSTVLRTFYQLKLMVI